MATQQQREAVLELFESSFERVYGFVRKHADPETSEEVAQEVFFRLLSLEDFENKEVSVSYLIKIADNLLKRRYRRLERWKRVGDRLSRESLPANWAKTAPYNEADEMEPQTVSAAMNSLSGGEREAVRLIVCEGLSYEDAARSLGVEVSTVNNWKHRGIQKLKQHVGTERGRATEGTTRERRGRARQSAMPGRSSRGFGGHDECL
ncbi:MAG: RNA polymerase sigma factor [Phycisphaerales bacterium]